MNIFVIILIVWAVGVNAALFLFKETVDYFKLRGFPRLFNAFIWPVWAIIFSILNVLDGLRGMFERPYE